MVLNSPVDVDGSDAAYAFWQIRADGGTPGSDLERRAHRQLVESGEAAPVEQFSLRDYSSSDFGPFLGISNEGYGAALIADAAYTSPKAVALGNKAGPLEIGIAVDGEVLGGIGEVPVGPEELARIWLSCIGRTLMTTNIGARVNPRTYRPNFSVTVDLGADDFLASAKKDLAEAFKPFVAAPGGGRPLLVFVDFTGSGASAGGALETLRQFVERDIATSNAQRIGLRVVLAGGPDDEDRALAGLDLAKAAGVTDVVFDGIVRRAADRAISLPGLLNYFEREVLNRLLAQAGERGLRIRPFNDLDADTVARQVWSGLNTARGFGLHLGKYGLVPLTLDESDVVVGHIQDWLGAWSAAPVCYVDRDLVTSDRVYFGDSLKDGIELWLRMVARHKVEIVLIDTVDKAEGRKILKTGGDPKGLLTLDEIAALDRLGSGLGIKVLWAGGITREQAYDFGKLGVFGLYVTSAVSDRAPASGIYLADPGLDAEKRPNPDKIREVKTLIEAGFLAARFAGQSPTSETAEISRRMAEAGMDATKLGRVLPDAWRSWWARSQR